MRFFIVCLCACVLIINQAHAYEISDFKKWIDDPAFDQAQNSFDIKTLEHLYADGNLLAGYAMAEFLLKGEGVAKNSARAIRVLQDIADQGFGPAQGFLGSIYMHGVDGGPPQPKKAVPLMIAAVKWGHNPSMLDLGMAYFNGNIASGAGSLYEGYKWISRASRAGEKRAEGIQQQVIKKYGVPQPRSQGGLIVEKGFAIDPLSANLGFTEDFADIYYASLFKNDQVIQEIRKNRLGRHPIYFYELARRLAHTDSEEAVYWYLVGGYRMRYHTKRCTDKTALGATQVMPMALNSEKLRNAFKALTADGKLYRIYKKAVIDASAMPLDGDPTWACRHGMRAVMAAMDGKDPVDMLVPREQWPTINQELKSYTLNLIEEKYAPKP